MANDETTFMGDPIGYPSGTPLFEMRGNNLYFAAWFREALQAEVDRMVDRRLADIETKGRA